MNRRFPLPMPTMVLLASVDLLAACASAPSTSERWYEGLSVSPHEMGTIGNFSAFGDRVYFAGQPGERDFDLLAGEGVKTVINLRTPGEMESLGFDERKTVEAKGMQYLHVPIATGEPGAEAIEQLMTAIDRAQDAPVLIHCASSNRVGYVWAMYRATRHGLDVESAVVEGKAAGMKLPALEKRAREFIERQSGAVAKP